MNRNIGPRRHVARPRTRPHAQARASGVAAAAALGAALITAGVALPASAASAASAPTTPAAHVPATWDPDQRIHITSATLDETAGELTVDLTFICQTGLAALVEIRVAQTVDEDLRLAYGENERGELTCTGEPQTTTVATVSSSNHPFIVGSALIGASLETTADLSSDVRQMAVVAAG